MKILLFLLPFTAQSFFFSPKTAANRLHRMMKREVQKIARSLDLDSFDHGFVDSATPFVLTKVRVEPRGTITLKDPTGTLSMGMTLRLNLHFARE